MSYFYYSTSVLAVLKDFIKGVVLAIRRINADLGQSFLVGTFGLNPGCWIRFTLFLTEMKYGAGQQLGRCSGPLQALETETSLRLGSFSCCLMRSETEKRCLT